MISLNNKNLLASNQLILTILNCNIILKTKSITYPTINGKIIQEKQRAILVKLYLKQKLNVIVNKFNIKWIY